MAQKFERGAPVDLDRLVKREKREKPAPAKPPASLRGLRLGPRRARLFLPPRAYRATYTVAARIVSAMRPGGWYGRPDMQRLTGLSRDTVKGNVMRMVERGLLELDRDPDWRTGYRKGEAISSAATIARRQPEWLFRLTEVGEAYRRLALMLA